MSAALFQSTHPVRGATHHLDGGFRARPISIHAPREGCDESTVILELSSGFQSTHPVRGATGSIISTNRLAKFQSTHPVRGATVRLNSHAARWEEFQSTHPVRGATGHQLARRPVHGFQSTHPVRGATHPWTPLTPNSRFQSTHPVRGATDLIRQERGHVGISIHAPREGCDPPRATRLARMFYFNPRTP